MQRSLIAAIAVLALAGLGASAYVTLRPAPASTPTATSTAPTSSPQAIATTTTSEQPPVTATPIVEQPPATPPISTTTGFKTYCNEAWGFAFEYPEGWEVMENTFSGYSSLFNVVLMGGGTVLASYHCGIFRRLGAARLR